MKKKMIMVRATEEETETLARYAAQTGRTQSEIIRELIRSLERKLRPADQPAAVKPVARKGARL